MCTIQLKIAQTESAVVRNGRVAVESGVYAVGNQARTCELLSSFDAWQKNKIAP